MRTTLDIDDDVLLAAKEHAARERKSLGAVISALARESLRQPAQPGGRSTPARRHGRFAVLPQRDEVVTLEHVRGLQDAEGV
ncbi:MAG TPA: CopG family transcriptional regulator [Ramlibacter sp.]|uniref:CopG family transcriptional regulator n=1 Tax=Ramlibacter sp. TaxID=1917967 RepID=UPI002D7F1DA3|nr:CopG family transcriptional regulator [Ramlibacter sp.]HET8748552.1 CopG family transcriptional regulator [Ramlibacter sp.]